MRNALCCLCLLFIGTLPAAAQTEAGLDPQRKDGRSAWFACLAKPEGLESPVKVLAGDKITPLELPEFMTSAAVTIPSDGILRIVREVPDATKPGKMTYLILGEAKIPDGVREALVILAPFQKPEGDLIFQSKIQDLASFKGGDRLFMNLSDTDIGVKIGETPVAVPAQKATIYSSPKLADPANMPIVYSYYHPEQKKWKLLTATTVVVMPTRREICVFNNGTRIGKVKKYSILFPVQGEQDRGKEQ